MNHPRGSRQTTAPTGEQMQGLGAAQLAQHAEALGLSWDVEPSRGEKIKAIVARQTLIGGLHTDVLAELLAWGDRRASPGADKTAMAAEASKIRKMDFNTLSHQGLVALAQLRGVQAPADADARSLIRALTRQETFLGKLARKRRRFVGKLIGKLVGEAEPSPDIADNGDAPEPSLKEKIEEHGLVAGLADRLRGAADDYVAVKLDEIELRIDKKLDEIDRRLAEWRDREVANRLRIIKLTFGASVVVALISIAYAWLKKTFSL